MQKQVQGLFSLTEIFENNIFRIPDYQRGYSWKEEHFNDLWEDIERLDGEKIHYTGMITVQKLYKDNIEIWKKEDLEFDNDLKINFNEKIYEPFYITDGQQRLTTLVILLSAIRDHEEWQNKEDLENYFIAEKVNGKVLYKFGYEFASQGREYLVSQIFSNPKGEIPKEETNYTQNIKKAKRFFDEKLKDLVSEELEEIYQKISKQLHFNFYEIPETLDIFTIFETMNYRGKPLTTLELLKNRLIYLISHSKDGDDYKKIARKEVNKSWATIYKELARNNKNILNDDDFLRIHWLIYFNHKGKNSEKLQKYKQNLLDEIFTKQNFEKNNYRTTYISDYAISLGDTVKYYFAIKNPMYSNTEVQLDSEIKKWIAKINKLSPKSHFEPLIFASLIKNEGIKKVRELLKNIEKYLFWTLAIAGIRSNFNKVPFLIETSYYFNGENEVTIDSIIKKLNPILQKKSNKRNKIGQETEIFDGETEDKEDDKKIGEKIEAFGDMEAFGEAFRKKQEKNMNQEEGFLSWKYLKYFLSEYESYLSNLDQNIGKNINVDKSSVELIFPPKKEIPQRDKERIKKVKDYGNEREKNWKIFFKKDKIFFKKDKDRTEFKIMHNLSYSLGNIVLNNKDAKIEDASSFEEKKEKYQSGTLNQREICEEKEWGANEILNRGIKLLEFLEQRWEIKLNETLKKQILVLTRDTINAENTISDELTEQEDDNLFKMD